MTTPNPDPLQKQILDIDLSKGLNERERPETAESTVLTRVENLLQDQTGAYVKRYGTPYLGATSVDAAGSTIPNPTKLLRLRGGLGMIANSGKYYQYQERNSRMTRVDEVPDFNVSVADQVVSSATMTSPKIHYVASSTKFHALIHEIGPGVAADGGWRLVLYERASNAVVKTVILDGTAYPRMVFVDDRYLHLYVNYAGITLYVIDTGVAAFTTTTTTVSAAGPTLTDVDVASGRSFVLYETATPNSRLSAFDNTGTIITGPHTLTGTGHLALSVYSTSVWSWNATVCEARSTTALGTVVVASAAGGPAVTGGAYFSTTVNTSFFKASQANVAFGGTVIPAITLNDGGVLGAGTIHGWNIASRPFVNASTGIGYLHVTKSNGLTVVAHAVIKMTFKCVNSVTANTYYSYRIAASLEPMLGVANSDVLKYFQVSGGEFCPAVPIQTVARGYTYCVFSLKPYFHSGVTTQAFGGQNYLSGAAHVVIGGNKLQENGFVDMPVINGAVSATAGPTGSYKHIAVYRYVDETGAITWSRTSVLASTTVAAKGIDLTVAPPNVNMRDSVLSGNPVPQLQSVEVYRTKTGGTVYYLCGSSQVGTPATGLLTQLISLGAAGFYTFTDVLTDANLGLQPTLFRQPGTANAAVDRYPPPCGNILCQHKDRLFTSDPYGVRVYYSSFFVDGETAWYNPVFSFFVHGGSGPITGMVSMDGRLFVFKRDGVFVIDGDGPAEGGVAGNEFSPPQRLATEYGCIDQRSIVVTTEGIVYRSARGIEILTRSLQVKWLGERVQTTVSANPKVCGAVLDSFGRYHIGLAASDTGTATQAATLGVELVYDFNSDCWVSSYHTDSSGVARRCVQDICQADLYGVGETVCYADPQSGVCYTDTTSGFDRNAYYVGWTVETAWIRTGQQARAKFSKALLLAKRRDNHKITISVAYDFVDSYTELGTFQPNTLNAAVIEALNKNFTKHEAMAVRLLIQEAAPTDTVTYPVATGRGCELLGISVEIAPKQGAPKLPSGQKV